MELWSSKILLGGVEALLNRIYPVGSIYISTNNVNPKTFIGGEWDPLPEGKTLWTIQSGSGGQVLEAGLPNITGKVNIRGSQNSDGNVVTVHTAGAFKTGLHTGASWGNSLSLYSKDMK